ncbi:MAG: YfhO family protein [Kiritimatiellae bacterium]|nr:YfhO family protein [Kiritimatiellia bacterium]
MFGRKVYSDDNRVSFWRTLVLVAAPIVLAAVAVYWDSLFSGKWLASGDNLPVFGKAFRSTVWKMFYGYWSPESLGVARWGRPLDLIYLVTSVLPPKMFNVGSFLLSTLLLYFACVYWLRGRKFGWPSAVIASLWLAFVGYGFTLISAGHRPIFDMLPWAVFLMGALVRAVPSGGMFYYALTGLFVGLGMGPQPDIMVFFVGLAGMYFVALVGEYRSRLRTGRAIRRMVCGVLVSGMVTAILFLPTLMFAKRNVLEARDEQRGETVESQWEYATNWSMPPEEIAEFFYPCIYGIETGDPRGPYWGRLGRTLGWRDTGRGFRNFRQHTVYLGAFAVLFAMYGVLGIVGRSRRKREVSSAKCQVEPRVSIDGRNAGGGVLADRRWDILFWSVVAVMALLLALGRYFPIYRAFFSLPFMGRIRCPIKFLHLVDLSLCMLFAVGVERFFQSCRQVDSNTPDVTGKAKALSVMFAGTHGVVLSVSLIGSVLSFLGAFMAGACSPSLGRYWQTIGMGTQSAVLAQTLQGALRHGGWVFLSCSVAFALLPWCRRRPQRRCDLLIVGLIVILLVDISVVCKMFVRVRDLSFYYLKNPIAEMITEDPEYGRTSYHLSSPQRGDPLWLNFLIHGADMLTPQAGSKLDEGSQQVFSVLEQNPLRLWQLTGTRFVLGSAKALEGLVRHPAFAVVTRFDVTRRGLVPNTDGGEHVLLRYRDALPRAVTFGQWRVIDDAAAMKELTNPAWKPGTELLVAANTSLPKQAGTSLVAAPARIRKWSTTRVEVDVDVTTDSILLLNDRYDPECVVKVDGRRQPMLKCNAIMRGVVVPPGRHEVVFLYRPNMLGFVAGCLVTVFVLGWGGVRLLRRYYATNSQL